MGRPRIADEFERVIIAGDQAFDLQPGDVRCQRGRAAPDRRAPIAETASIANPIAATRQKVSLRRIWRRSMR